MDFVKNNKLVTAIIVALIAGLTAFLASMNEETETASAAPEQVVVEPVAAETAPVEAAATEPAAEVAPVETIVVEEKK